MRKLRYCVAHTLTGRYEFSSITGNDVESDKLKQLVDKLSGTNELYEERYKSFGRFWAEITNDKEKFMSYLLDDIEHTRQMNKEIFHHLIDDEKGTYEYPPKLLATEIKGHILRVESLSNFFMIVMTVLGIAVSVSVSGWFKLFVVVVWVTLVSAVKWNVDKHLVNKKQLVNHLDSYPECPRAPTHNKAFKSDS